VLRTTKARNWNSENVRLLAALGCLLVLSTAMRAQDTQPSVAAAARQARKDRDKDKSAASAKNIITDESLADGTGAVSAEANSSKANGAASSDLSSANSSGKGSLDEAYARLQATEASLERLEPLGKSDLAAIVLHGNTADFPNRAQWEDKLYSAKETYIERSRKLLEAMSQVLANMEALQSNGHEKVSSNDPRVQSLIRKTKQIMQLAAQTEAAFQSVISEGQNLALQPAPR
jgi:hypothetical protein